MNRFKCPACGGNQYTACDTAEWCVYCGNKELKKMETLEQKEDEEIKESIEEQIEQIEGLMEGGEEDD